MAYLSTGSQGNTLSGGGGYSGTGTTVGGKQKTTAGTPDSWYNIQDFLSANPQTPNVASRLQQKGSEQLGAAQGEFQKQVGALPTIPTAEKYSQDRFQGMLQGGVDPNETQSLTKYMNQSYTPSSTPQQLLPGVESPYKDIQPGSFDSLMKWYGNLEKPSAAYTPGMQKMDEMLLRGQEGYAENFPTQMQNQFKSTVIDPLEAKRVEYGQQQKSAQSEMPKESSNWTQGISSFLGGEKQKIQSLYDKQQAEFNKVQSTPIKDIAGYKNFKYSNIYPSYDTTPGMNKPSPNMPAYQMYNIPGVNIQDYAQRLPYTAPSMNTAVNAMYSPEQLNTYNTLSGLLPKEEYGTYTQGEAFNPGGWAFKEDAYQNAVRRAAQQVAEAQNQSRIQQLLGMPSVQLANGQTPQQAGLASYNVPTYTSSPFGQVQLTMPQAGQTIWQPYTVAQALQQAQANGGSGGGLSNSGNSGGGYGSSGGDAGGGWV